MKRSAPEAKPDHASASAPAQPATSRGHTLPATFMLDRAGRITRWSTSAETALGSPAAEAVGRQAHKLLEGSGHRVDQDWLAQAWSRAEDNEPYSVVLTVLSASGGHLEPKILDCSPIVGAGGRMGLLCQISDLKPRTFRTETQLAFIDAVLRGSPFGLGMLDKDLRYVMVNDTLARLNGLPVEEHVGRLMNDVVRTEDGGEYEEKLREVLRTGEPLERLLIGGRTEGHPDRDRVWAVSFFRLTNDGGSVLGLGGMVVDVTQSETSLLEASAVRQRLTLVNEASSRIGTTLEISQTAQELADVAVPEFADAVSVEIRQDLSHGPKVPPPEADVRTYRTACQNVLDAPVMEQLCATKESADIVHPVGSLTHRALCSPHSLLIKELDEPTIRAYAHSPEHAHMLRECGLQSLIMVPLTARGRLLGIVHFGRSSKRDPLTDEDVKVAEELAARAAMCLDNARMYGNERRIAVELQRNMLPEDEDIPRRPGLEIARHYRPSSSSAQVGGDWFDVIPLSGHRVALVIGDMMGHDITAAANMGQLRTAMRTLARLDLDPATLLSRLDDIVQRDATIPYATCVYSVYDTVTRECSVASAGHPAPVLRHADGTTELLHLDPGVPLGVGIGDPQFEVTDLVMPEESTLVLYTDGLIERRGEDIDAGIESLRTALARPEPSVHQLCADLVAEMRSSGSDEDDLAVLMAHVPCMPSQRSARWRFPATRPSAGRARAAVRQTLAEWGLEELVEDTTLLVSELVTNALLYSRGEIELRLAKGMTLLVEVADRDERTPRRCNADSDDERGRGLALVGEIAQDWGTRRTPSGKIVWCEVALLEAAGEGLSPTRR